MGVVVGTCGYSYKEWKGGFYPEKLPATRMLGFYAERFPTVEINNTFYRMPSRALLGGWAQQVPPGFRFALKVPQRITHTTGVDEQAVRYFLEVSAALGEKRGPVLFQLPPYQHKDVTRLERFLQLVRGVRAAFEFRHASWFDEEVRAALEAAGAALCAADTDELPADELPFLSTARWGYLRLRRPDYGEAALRAWLERIREQRWEEAFVYLKHAQRAPQRAAQLMALEREPERRRGG